jgi:hypothetical protein
MIEKGDTFEFSGTFAVNPEMRETTRIVNVGDVCTLGTDPRRWKCIEVVEDENADTLSYRFELIG